MSAPWTIHDLELRGGEAGAVGTTLIEASAGTGKTYTISGLVARLVSEGAASIDRVLVVTFTRAATKELRERIRARLSELLALAERALDHEDFTLPGDTEPFVRQWYQQASVTRTELQLQRWRLARAVEDMDLAPISTIHGFCQRALRDRAFEGALPMDRELVQDVADRLEQLCRDFAITRLHDEDPGTVDDLLPWFGKPALQVARWVARDRELPTVPSVTPVPESVWRAALGALRDATAAFAAEADALGLIEAVVTHPGRNRSKISAKATASLRATGQRVVAAAAAGRLATPSSEELEYLEKCLHRSTLSCFKKGIEPPDHPGWSLWEPWIDAADEVLALRKRRIEGIRGEFVAFVRDELPRRMQRDNVQSFDDLLAELHAAVTGDDDRARRVVAALRTQYDAALIDEFQDTSPIQFDIFDRVFAGHTPLFYIGDPKQAIYQFRGADVYAYLRAATRVDVRRTLATNFRSDPGVLAAINALFERPNAFRVEEIPYVPVAARPGRADSWARGGQPEAAVRVAVFDAERMAASAGLAQAVSKRGGGLKSAPSQELVAAWTADDIGHLLTGDCTIDGGRPVRPGDVAVLVRTNAQGELVQRALRARGIAAVRASSGDVFASESAADVTAVVEAIAEPSRAGIVTRALATTSMGRTAHDLASLRDDDSAWDALVERFASWRARWEERGVMAALQQWLRDEAVARRLLGLPDGERRMTDLLHVVELIHSASVSERLGIDGVLRWIAGQREASSDAALLRTESEAEAVQIVTMHKAKGLEYAVAYCPYLWQPGRKLSTPFRVHDPEQGDREVAVIGDAFDDDDDQALWKGLAEAEQEAESVRLAYVAITRARHHAVLVTGELSGVTGSPLFALLHGDRDPSSALTAADAIEDVQSWASRSGGAVQAVLAHGTAEFERLPPADDAAVDLQPRTVTRRRDLSWRIASYSALLRGDRAHDRPAQDHDAEPTGRLPTERALSDDAEIRELLDDDARLAALRGGTATGTMVHAIFEHARFEPVYSQERRDIVASQLRAYGFDAAWEDPVLDWVERVLRTPMTASGLTLSSLSPAQRLDELEFLLPVGGTEPTRLTFGIARAIRRYGDERLQRHADAIEALPAHALTGYLRGYIDLAFTHGDRWYVLDYKTNVLDDAVAYRADRLGDAMLHGMYTLQYHLYLVALHRYLLHRLPDYDIATHLGGALYLFVRGMHPDLGHRAGVYADTASPELILAIDDALRGQHD